MVLVGDEGCDHGAAPFRVHVDRDGPALRHPRLRAQDLEAVPRLHSEMTGNPMTMGSSVEILRDQTCLFFQKHILLTKKRLYAFTFDKNLGNTSTNWFAPFLGFIMWLRGTCSYDSQLRARSSAQRRNKDDFSNVAKRTRESTEHKDPMVATSERPWATGCELHRSNLLPQ